MKHLVRIEQATNSALCGYFCNLYPKLNDYLLRFGREEKSRYGDTQELIDFKTVILKPTHRVVGGQMRDINIFFLLAEAMWIFTGKSDVEFLVKFNSRMNEFSDDGKTFHAAYGKRIRHWGIGSSGKTKGEDQLEVALQMLNRNPQDRRVVIAIWNPSMDLDTDSKDIPCNDLLMYKIRGGELMLSIANRSNDLHWGLPTNVFQFSFITEVMARILKVEVGRQVHNSHSLHIYTDNEIAEKMAACYKKGYDMNQDIYDVSQPTEMDFKFKAKDVSKKLSQVDEIFNSIIEGIDDEKPTKVKGSKYFQHVANMLHVYSDYADTKRNDGHRIKAIEQLSAYMESAEGMCTDYYIMALNWFFARIKDNDKRNICHRELLDLLPRLREVQLGMY